MIVRANFTMTMRYPLLPNGVATLSKEAEFSLKIKYVRQYIFTKFDELLRTEKIKKIHNLYIAF